LALEARTGLSEQGGLQRFVLPSGATFAENYSRIVYGDRGPYLEFARAQILVELTSRFGNPTALPSPTLPVFYLWLHPVSDPEVKVYWQSRTVSYADYRRGLYYVAPGQLLTPGSQPRRPTLW
jgi:hypothetical protein